MITLPQKTGENKEMFRGHPRTMLKRAEVAQPGRALG